MNPGTPPFGSELHKVPVHQLYDELFSRGRYELTHQVFAQSCPVHFGNRHLKLEEAVAEGKGWRSAAPNLTMKVDEINVNGDIVNVAWTARGTHTGQGHGLRPTGKLISLRGKSKFRVANGRIVEAWNEEYQPELFRQLGFSRTQSSILFTGLKVWSLITAVSAAIVSALKS